MGHCARQAEVAAKAEPESVGSGCFLLVFSPTAVNTKWLQLFPETLQVRACSFADLPRASLRTQPTSWSFLNLPRVALLKMHRLRRAQQR